MSTNRTITFRIVKLEMQKPVLFCHSDAETHQAFRFAIPYCTTEEHHTGTRNDDDDDDATTRRRTGDTGSERSIKWKSVIRESKTSARGLWDSFHAVATNLLLLPVVQCDNWGGEEMEHRLCPTRVHPSDIRTGRGRKLFDLSRGGQVWRACFVCLAARLAWGGRTSKEGARKGCAHDDETRWKTGAVGWRGGRL